MSPLPPPLARPLSIADPLTALDALAELPHAFLLHSALLGPHARWSFFGADPFAWFEGGSWDEARDAWRRCADLTRSTGGADEARAPFTGGAVGAWSYDFGRRFERLPAAAPDDLGLPDFVMGLYDVVGAFDHATGEAWLFSSGLPEESAAGERRAAQRLEEFERRVAHAPPKDQAGPTETPGETLAARSTFTAAGYREAVEAIREHIRRGDIFQANLTQQWRLPIPAAWGAQTPGAIARRVFRALSQVSAAPFAAFLDAGGHAIASASPERFLEVRGRRAAARPMKGTRPRGQCLAEDEMLAAELERSVKDRAENVMIVDVLRNDLGRVCEAGSVETPELCVLEAFPQVFHLTSTVTGALRAGRCAFDLLEAAFPGGSITGAPKLRAIEILDRLEPARRHIYTGAIGYVDWSGDADWNIAIRTALVTADAIRFAAGGGVTADSDPELERLESLHKAEGMRLALSLVLGPVALDGAESATRSER